MKGLVAIPSFNDRQATYELLMSGQSISISQLTLWSQWVRFDPRLGEILISYLSLSWASLNPLEVNQMLKIQPWPAVFGVLLDQVRLYKPPQCGKEDFSLFVNWCLCSMSSIKPAQGEQFFIGLMSFGGPQMKKEVFLTTKPYLRWGYFGHAIMVNKYPQERGTHCDHSRRNQVLEELIQSETPITVETYRAKLDYAVSIRQAQRDLAKHPRIRGTGHTRRHRYFITKAPQRRRPNQ